LFHQYDLSLGAGWAILDSGFDWRYLFSIDFQAANNSTLGNYTFGSLWVNGFYFSYYQLVLGTLNVLAQGPGGSLSKSFSLDGTTDNTPYSLGLEPATNFTLTIDSTDFLHWEDGSSLPQRTLNLSEGQVLTVTAYYSTGGGVPASKLALGVALSVLGAAVAGYLYFRKFRR
jgi:hypothetical protein